jgi:hypothetical protein
MASLFGRPLSRLCSLLIAVILLKTQVSDGTVLTLKLYEKSSSFSSASIGTKVIFAGGLLSTVANAPDSASVNCFDALNPNIRLSLPNLTQSRHNAATSVVGDEVLFPGQTYTIKT